MVDLTGIATMKTENVFGHLNHLADIAKIYKFTQEQIDIAHRTSNKADAPIIILFNKKGTEQASEGYNKPLFLFVEKRRFFNQNKH